jgi:hypothetical protein
VCSSVLQMPCGGSVIREVVMVFSYMYNNPVPVRR